MLIASTNNILSVMLLITIVTVTPIIFIIYLISKSIKRRKHKLQLLEEQTELLRKLADKEND